jgi:hypothetical protein
MFVVLFSSFVRRLRICGVRTSYYLGIIYMSTVSLSLHRAAGPSRTEHKPRGIGPVSKCGQPQYSAVLYAVSSLSLFQVACTQGLHQLSRVTLWAD